MKSLAKSILGFFAVVAIGAGVAAGEQDRPPATASKDPRVGLKAGFRDAGEAAQNLELVAAVAKPEGFFNPQAPEGEPAPPEKTPEEEKKEKEEEEKKEPTPEE